MTQISAKVVADSINKFGDRITTMELVMPRFILAEFNTHRMFSRNSASSRAIRPEKMLEMVQENPFIPMAFQREHKGMQGKEYLTGIEAQTAKDIWISAMRSAVLSAQAMVQNKITKQLVNRLLEPFMYHKVLVTSTEWENFFKLRAPQYQIKNEQEPLFRSWKELTRHYSMEKDGFWNHVYLNTTSTSLKLRHNKGQAEIHMMTLAECMWDAMNESTPRQLKEGEWHIPYKDQIPVNRPLSERFAVEDNITGQIIEMDFSDDIPFQVKVSTGMAAHVSYTTIGIGKETTHETFIRIHDDMIKADPFHASPFEHCARAMSHADRVTHLRGIGNPEDEDYDGFGWSRNFKGFIQYREIIEEKINNNGTSNDGY